MVLYLDLESLTNILTCTSPADDDLLGERDSNIYDQELRSHAPQRFGNHRGWSSRKADRGGYADAESYFDADDTDTDADDTDMDDTDADDTDAGSHQLSATPSPAIKPRTILGTATTTTNTSTTARSAGTAWDAYSESTVSSASSFASSVMTSASASSFASSYKTDSGSVSSSTQQYDVISDGRDDAEQLSILSGSHDREEQTAFLPETATELYSMDDTDNEDNMYPKRFPNLREKVNDRLLGDQLENDEAEDDADDQLLLVDEAMLDDELMDEHLMDEHLMDEHLMDEQLCGSLKDGIGTEDTTTDTDEYDNTDEDDNTDADEAKKLLRLIPPMSQASKLAPKLTRNMTPLTMKTHILSKDFLALCEAPSDEKETAKARRLAKNKSPSANHPPKGFTVSDDDEEESLFDELSLFEEELEQEIRPKAIARKATHPSKQKSPRHGSSNNRIYTNTTRTTRSITSSSVTERAEFSYPTTQTITVRASNKFGAEKLRPTHWIRLMQSMPVSYILPAPHNPTHPTDLSIQVAHKYTLYCPMTPSTGSVKFYFCRPNFKGASNNKWIRHLVTLTNDGPRPRCHPGLSDPILYKRQMRRNSFQQVPVPREIPTPRRKSMQPVMAFAADTMAEDPTMAPVILGTFDLVATNPNTSEGTSCMKKIPSAPFHLISKVKNVLKRGSKKVRQTIKPSPLLQHRNYYQKCGDYENENAVGNIHCGLTPPRQPDDDENPIVSILPVPKKKDGKNIARDRDSPSLGNTATQRETETNNKVSNHPTQKPTSPPAYAANQLQQQKTSNIRALASNNRDYRQRRTKNPPKSTMMAE